MSPADWIAIVALASVNVGAVWGFSLRIERRLTAVETILGMRKRM